MDILQDKLAAMFVWKAETSFLLGLSENFNFSNARPFNIFLTSLKALLKKYMLSSSLRQCKPFFHITTYDSNWTSRNTE